MYIAETNLLRSASRDAFVVMHKTFRMPVPKVEAVFENQERAENYAYDQAVKVGPVQEALIVRRNLPLTTVYKVMYTNSRADWFSVVKTKFK